MPQTIVTSSDVKSKKYWSSMLLTEFQNESYFSSRFSGEGENYVIQNKTELETGKGDKISFDLSVRLRQIPTKGDSRLKGKEENLRFFTDEVVIDQLRHSVSCGGVMTNKRVAHNMRSTAKDRMKEYWVKYYDEAQFICLSGARGINLEFTEPVSYTGTTAMPIQAPDSAHILYAGSATSKATLTAADKMSRTLVERAATKATMFQAGNPDTQNMAPVRIEGEARYVLLMNKFQAYDLRTSDTAGWIDIQKAAAAAEGRNNPIFKGSLGMINNVVLHSHESGIRFSDYGASSNVAAGRALLLGRQAAVMAWGTAGSGLRFSWKEETEDYENETVVAAGLIIGLKKTRFNGYDFGVLALDTAAADPNA